MKSPSGLRIISLALLHLTFLNSPVCRAQLGQVGSGTTTGGGSTGAAAAFGGAAGTTAGGAGAGGQGAAAGGTAAEGAGGVTTQGLGASGLEGGVAGGNATQRFVGGNNTAGFVGGALETQTTSNRQFRAITDADVPTGGSQPQTTSSPRRVPTSLKVAIDYPTPISPGSQFQGLSSYSVRLAQLRPELSQVAVSVSDSGVATLAGRLPDAAARRLVSNLLRLDPGIRRIDDRTLIGNQNRE